MSFKLSLTLRGCYLFTWHVDRNDCEILSTRFRGKGLSVRQIGRNIKWLSLIQNFNKLKYKIVVFFFRYLLLVVLFLPADMWPHCKYRPIEPWSDWFGQILLNWQHSEAVSPSVFLTVNHGKFPKQEDSYAFEDSSSESLSPDQHHSDESQGSACPSSNAVGSTASSSSSPVLNSSQKVLFCIVNLPFFVFFL